MHYIGMQAATYFPSNAKTSARTIASSTLMWICLTLSLTASIVFLLVNMWLRSLAVQEQGDLTLTLVCVNPRGQILTTLTHHLPSRTISAKYSGNPLLGTSPDFVRMFRASFMWSQHAEQFSTLQGRRGSVGVTQEALDLFSNFTAAASQVSFRCLVLLSNLSVVWRSWRGRLESTCPTCHPLLGFRVWRNNKKIRDSSWLCAPIAHSPRFVSRLHL